MSADDLKSITKIGAQVWGPLMEGNATYFGSPVSMPTDPESPTLTLRPGSPTQVDLDKSVSAFTGVEILQLRDWLIHIEQVHQELWKQFSAIKEANKTFRATNSELNECNSHWQHQLHKEREEV